MIPVKTFWIFNLQQFIPMKPKSPGAFTALMHHWWGIKPLQVESCLIPRGFGSRCPWSRLAVVSAILTGQLSATFLCPPLVCCLKCFLLQFSCRIVLFVFLFSLSITLYMFFCICFLFFCCCFGVLHNRSSILWGIFSILLQFIHNDYFKRV